MSVTPGQTIGGYEVLRKEPLEHMEGEYIELVHTKTSARHIHIACPDDNKTFGVLFPTVPKDSTGVAHILEHVVLAGSERFNVRDPFFSMISRSLKTFMNAMTASDATVYPFSTRNTKDFFNLLEVYLDACFFPRIAEDSFKQEGHRFEFTDAGDPNSNLIYKGVVFNEMKGAMATPAAVLGRGIGKALFPELTYANNSGGAPENIPDLTWEQLRNFHAVHYHPSNAHFFTYGDIDLPVVLQAIEKQVLSKFDRIEVDLTIPDVNRFAEARFHELSYALGKDENHAKKSQALVGWVTSRVSDSFETLALSILSRVLLGNSSSPLQKALIDSGIGEALADGTGLHRSFREAVFAAGLKGIEPQDAAKVQDLVIDTLEQLVTEGIGKEQIDAAIHQVEIEEREVSNAGAPYGLIVFMTLLRGYFYGGDPYKSLRFDEDLDAIKAQMAKGAFFEDLIRRWMLDNTHRSLIVVSPDYDLENKTLAAEQDKLAKIQASLSQQEKQTIVEDAARLKDAQEAKQDLSSLPTLELSDVPAISDDVVGRYVDVSSNRIGFYSLPTNGLTYIDIRADFSQLDDELKDYLSLFSSAVPKMGTSDEDYAKLAQRIAASTGGISAGNSVRPLASGGGFLQSWQISGKSLARNHAAFISILNDLLTSVDFEPKRLKDVLGQLKGQKEASVVPAGTNYAMLLASAQLSRPSVLNERIDGLSSVGLIKRLVEDNDMSTLIDKMDRIRDYLFRANNLQICVTSDGRDEEELRGLIETLLSNLPSDVASGKEEALKPRMLKPQARTTSVPVAFNAKVFSTVGYTHPDAPALKVLAPFMRQTYLHRELREKGGAYGGFALSDGEGGSFSMASHRDPNITRTFQVFDDAVAEVSKGDIDREDIKEAILTVCGAIDPLESPDIKGKRRFFGDLAGYTVELRRAFKQSVLEVGEEDLRRVADTYLAEGKAALATISNPEMVAKANEDMGNIFEISAI
ncbi:MAG: insulinase family protein [Actinomycetota bacterium]